MASNSPELWPSTDATVDPTDTASEPERHDNPESHSEEAVTAGKDSASSAPAESVPSGESVVSTDNMEKKSKSQRIREFLEQNPEARNRDIAAELQPFGVTAADVANVKAQQKNKGAGKKTANASEAAAQLSVIEEAPKKSAKKAGRPKTSAGNKRSKTAARTSDVAPPAVRKQAGGGEIGLSEVDAAIQFIEQAGGIDRALQIIELVQRIRSMKLG